MMIFFNERTVTRDIADLLLKAPELKFVVEQNLIVECTGEMD